MGVWRPLSRFLAHRDTVLQGRIQDLAFRSPHIPPQRLHPVTSPDAASAHASTAGLLPYQGVSLPHPHVSPGPREPGARSLPYRRFGPAGPSTVMSFTVPCPRSSFSRRTKRGANRRSCVAHVVESQRTVSTRSSSAKCSGTQCSAMSGPTISDHRPVTPPTATETSQPRSAVNRSRAARNGNGSRPSGRAVLRTVRRRERSSWPTRAPRSRACSRAARSAALARSGPRRCAGGAASAAPTSGAPVSDAGRAEDPGPAGLVGRLGRLGRPASCRSFSSATTRPPTLATGEYLPPRPESARPPARAAHLPTPPR